MKIMKNGLPCLLLPALAFALIFSACDFNSSDNATNEKNPSGYPSNATFPGKSDGKIPTVADVSAINAVISNVESKIDLSALASDTSGAGATEIAATNEIVHITESGAYRFAGSYGGISIDEKELELHFIFDGANITNENGIAIDGTAVKKTSLVITLKDGATSTVTNSGSDANAIHIKGSLAINGGGTLNVTSGSKSAVKASKDIRITGATLNLAAQNHGIAGASVVAADCTINVSSADKDGINAECDEATEFTTDDGYVLLKNVRYTCDVQGDGIQADTVVYIDGGTYNIKTTGNFVQKTSANMTEYGMDADDFKYIYSNGTYKRIASDETSRYNASQLYGLSQGCKGIKVGEIEDADGNAITDGDYLIYIKNGSFTIDSTDDAIHANSGDVLIAGGTFTLSTYDDGITADGLTKITGGTIDITTSYEGIEGGYVEIAGGTISLAASDDGINAASDSASVTPHIIISGGMVTVDANGDGLDSNGNLLISGGMVTVHGPTSGADAGLDADGGIFINGGTVFVTSSSQMLEAPSSDSTQYTVVYKGQSTIAAGTTISLRDSNGSTVMSAATKKSAQAVIISSPIISSGASYTMYSGSTSLATFTVSSAVTQVGTSGGAQGGPGGRM